VHPFILSSRGNQKLLPKRSAEKKTKKKKEFAQMHEEMMKKVVFVSIKVFC